MKKLYTLILLITAAFSLKAQYTLTSASNPIIGDMEKTWKADTLTPNGLYPVGGTNQIWNFSGIVVSPTTTPLTTTYVAVSAAPNASLYGSANMAATSDGITYEMSNYSSSSITQYGTTNSSVSIVYQNPELIANLPLTYGTFCTDTYSASYTDNSVPVSRNGTVSTTGDGTGTLNMPGNKNYTNVLRIKLQITQIENYGAVASVTATINGYVYLNASSKFSILSTNVFTFTQVSGTTTSTFYGKSVQVGDMYFTGVKENDNTTNLNIFPNPSANKEITIQFSPAMNDSYELSIFNALGQEVKHLSYANMPAGDHNEKINLSELNSVLYSIKLKSKNHQSTQKLIVD